MLKLIKKIKKFLNEPFKDERAEKILLQALSTSKPELSNW